MEVVPLMSGAKGEEARQEYRNRMAAIVMMFGLLFGCGLLRLLALFSCLAMIAVLFSTRVFPSGNPTLMLRGLRVPT